MTAGMLRFEIPELNRANNIKPMCLDDKTEAMLHSEREARESSL